MPAHGRTQDVPGYPVLSLLLFLLSILEWFGMELLELPLPGCPNYPHDTAIRFIRLSVLLSVLAGGGWFLWYR